MILPKQKGRRPRDGLPSFLNPYFVKSTLGALFDPASAE
jgi:hypothetical protein